MTLSTDKNAGKWMCPTRRYMVNEESVLQWGGQPVYVEAPCSGAECPVWRWSDAFVRQADNSYEPLGFCGMGGPYGVAVEKPTYKPADAGFKKTSGVTVQ